MKKKSGSKSKPTKPVPRRPKITKPFFFEDEDNTPVIKTLPFLKVNLDVSKNFKTVEETFMLHFIIFTSLYNQDKKNSYAYYQGDYWARFSKERFSSSYKCLSKCSLGSALKKLEDKGLIVSGIFMSGEFPNQSKWYKPCYGELTIIGFSKRDCQKFFGFNY